MIITIDGPAGAGKSTVARIVARRLNFSYLDSGAIYRTLTLACLRKNASIEDEVQVLKVLDESRFHFTEEVVEGRRLFKCYLNGEDVTHLIREPAVSKAVSIVARHARVREKLLYSQRKFAENRNIVCDGRDMGSYVFRDADFKFYLTAAPEVRARRRYEELKRLGIEVNYSEVYENIVFRDVADSQRQTSPLKPASEAVVIDTTNLTPEEVAEKIIETVSKGKKR